MSFDCQQFSIIRGTLKIQVLQDLREDDDIKRFRWRFERHDRKVVRPQLDAFRCEERGVLLVGQDKVNVAADHLMAEAAERGRNDSGEAPEFEDLHPRAQAVDVPHRATVSMLHLEVVTIAVLKLQGVLGLALQNFGHDGMGLVHGIKMEDGR